MLILALCDFVASVVNPGHIIYRITTDYLEWESGEFGCRFLSTVGPVLSRISLGMILIMAIDRDREVSLLFKRQFHLVHIHMAIITNFFLSTLVFIPYISNSQVADYMGGSVCGVFNTGNDYHRGIVSIILISDILFVGILGTTTFRAWLRSRQPKITGPKKEMGNNEVFRTILVMGIAYAVCIFPRDILLVSFHLKKVFPPLIEGLESQTANELLKVLQTSYSCMNFMIYMVLNPVFRNEVYDKFKTLKKFRKVAVSPMIVSPQVLNHSGTNLKETKIDVPEDLDYHEKNQEECKIDIPPDCNQCSDKNQEELIPDIPKVHTPFRDQVDTNHKEHEVDVPKIQPDVIDVRVIACTPTNPDVSHEVSVVNTPVTQDVDREIPVFDAPRNSDVDQEVPVSNTPVTQDVDQEIPVFDAPRNPDVGGQEELPLVD